ncbi:MAG: hypothetical protein QXK93_05590 [Candidatus Bathyarchaeia archaeon]
MDKKAVIILCMVVFTVSLTILLAPLVMAAELLTQETSFTVTITVKDVKDLYGFDVKVHYDKSKVDLIEASPISPWKCMYIIVKNKIDEFNGMYQLAMAAVDPQEPFSGSAPLVKLAFYGVSDESSICLVEVELSDRNGNAIPHVIEGLTIRGLPVHDVTVKGIVGYPKGVYQGDPIYLYVTVENQGDFIETFTVTVYADRDVTIIGDEVIVGTQTVNSPAKTLTTLLFVWDTTNTPCGHYFISAEVIPVDGEIDIADNFLRAGEYIGGVHPRPQFVERAKMLAQIISLGILIPLASFTAYRLKEFWFP